MNRFIHLIFSALIIAASAPYPVTASTPSAISHDEAEELRSLLADMTSDLTSNVTELAPLDVAQFWPELLEQDIPPSPAFIQRMYDSPSPDPSFDPQDAARSGTSDFTSSDFPTDQPRLNPLQTAVDLGTLAVLNSLFNVISGSINIGSGGIGVIAATLGLEANVISRFFSRTNWGLGVDNFILTLVKDSGKWAATNTTIISETSSAWAALKSLGLDSGLKTGIDQQIEYLISTVKKFQNLAAKNL